MTGFIAVLCHYYTGEYEKRANFSTGENTNYTLAFLVIDHNNHNFL